MRNCITPQAMRAMEQSYFQKTGVASIALMERAASELTGEILRRLGDGRTLLAACGTGGNGGGPAADWREGFRRAGCHGIRPQLWRVIVAAPRGRKWPGSRMPPAFWPCASQRGRGASAGDRRSDRSSQCAARVQAASAPRRRPADIPCPGRDTARKMNPSLCIYARRIGRSWREECPRSLHRLSSAKSMQQQMAGTACPCHVFVSAPGSGRNAGYGSSASAAVQVRRITSTVWPSTSAVRWAPSRRKP